MAKIKVKTVDIQRTKNNASINLKGYSTVSIKTSESSDFLDVVKDVSVSGSTLKVTIGDKTLNFTNVNPDMFIQAVDTTGTVYYGSGNSIDIKTFFSEEKKISYNKIDCSNVSTKVTGSILSDEIDLSERKDLTKIVKVGKKKVSMPKESTDAGFSVNAGFGDDVITGSMYSDTITGGAGENKVVVKAEDFGNDTIKLTKGEKLTIDLTDYGFESAEDVLDILKISKNDLLLELKNGTVKNGTVKLANFAKTNGVGVDGSVELLLKAETSEGAKDEVLVNLNTDNLFEYATSDFKQYYKKIKGEKVPYAAKFTGTRFGDELNVVSDEVLDTVTKTINMGEGNNTVNIEGSGKNTVVCGSGSDTININENDAITTIKTGKGENTINIKSDSFGTVTLAEEKVGAKNIINFADGIIDNYTFTKSGNDLIINNGDSNKLTLTGYYVERTTRNKYSDIRFKLAGNETTYTVDELLKNTDKVVTITGKGKIIGTDSNDEFTSSTSNDTIIAKGGTNTIVYKDVKFGNDTIYLTKGENLELDMTGCKATFSYKTSGNNLVITAKDFDSKGRRVTIGTITLKDFAKTNVVGESGSVILKTDNKTIDLNTDELIVATPTGNYTGSRFAENIEPDNVKRPITITGGKGNDNIYSSNKNTTFVFNEGDGNDTIYETKAGDVIQINSSENVNYTQDGFDLVIGYGNNGDTIRVYRYYSETDSRIDTIKIKQPNGKYDTQSLESHTHVSEVLDQIFKTSSGTEIIEKEAKFKTILFNGGSSLSYAQGGSDEETTSEDLVISYMNIQDQASKVIIKEYMTGESNVKNMLVWTGAGYELFEIPYHVGTDKNDVFNSTKLSQEYYYLKGGDDTINFNGEFGQENKIYSQGTKTSTTDTIIFKDHSFEDGELTFTRVLDGELTIENNTDKYRSDRVSYVNFFNEDTPRINLKDKNGQIDLNYTNSSEAMDWSKDNQNHVLFVDAVGDNKAKNIVSNTKRNYIESYNALDYTYNGGKDVIDARGQSANDKYTVNNFTANTTLSIYDGGGNNDKMIVNASTDDFYLLFDVNKISGTYDPAGSTALVNKNAMTVETLKSFFKKSNFNLPKNTVEGIIKVGGNGNHIFGTSIENIITNDHKQGIDIAAWKNYITGNVVNWMNNNSITYYNIEKLFENIASGKYTLASEKYESLLNCFKVSYNKLEQNGVFISSVDNDTYNFESENNRVTIDNPTIGVDRIDSSKTSYNENNKDVINFTSETGYSFRSDTLDAKIDSSGNLIIGKKDDMVNNSVTYTDFVNNTSHNKLIVSDSYSIEYNVNYVANGEFQGSENSLVLADCTENKQTVHGNNRINIVKAFGNNGMEYEYKGGVSLVSSESESSNDVYKVSNFTQYSQMNIKDNGGDDTLYFGTNTSLISNSRLVFDVNKDGVINYDNDFMFVHSNRLDGGSLTVTNAINNITQEGVIKLDMSDSNTGFGLEKIAYGEFSNETGHYSGEVNLSSWVNKIAENVQGWLNSEYNAKGYTSAYQAFTDAGNMNSGALYNLQECYAVSYNDLQL